MTPLKLLSISKNFISIIETLVIKSNKKRWAIVASSGVPPWDARNEAMASLIPPGSSVLDMGSGPQTLKLKLPEGCTYQPCDLIKLTDDVMQVDFNNGEYPRDTGVYSHVIVSGVLEYIHDADRFLKECRKLGETILLSYNVNFQGQARLSRMTNHWVNHFTKAEIENIFSNAGMVSEVVISFENNEHIYRLKSREMGY